MASSQKELRYEFRNATYFTRAVLICLSFSKTSFFCRGVIMDNQRERLLPTAMNCCKLVFRRTNTLVPIDSPEASNADPAKPTLKQILLRKVSRVHLALSLERKAVHKPKLVRNVRLAYACMFITICYNIYRFSAKR